MLSQITSTHLKEISEETKGVGKTWKGKMVKKFKRYGSSSTAPVEISGTFGVPLELCPPSTFNEVSF